ncbi:MAG: Ig-like domain-containing protein [Candidatus Thermoplasmatota archaeon]
MAILVAMLFLASGGSAALAAPEQQGAPEEFADAAPEAPQDTGMTKWAPDRTDEAQREQRASMWEGEKERDLNPYSGALPEGSRYPYVSRRSYYSNAPDGKETAPYEKEATVKGVGGSAVLSVPVGPSPADTGGPDAWGYIWIDSNAPAPTVSYNWIDITVTGVNSGIVGDDNFGSAPIGFNFTFYANTYNTAYLSTNGVISFGAGTAAYSNTNIPNTATPNNMICVFWDDLSDGGGTIYYETIGTAPNRQFVVEWYNWYSLAGPGPMTFEIILNETGEIWFQYNALGTADSGSATVGIENSDGSIGLQYSFNNLTAIQPGLAIEFVYIPPPYRVFLSPDFQSNYSFPGTDVDYLLTVSNTGANNDTYNLSVAGNVWGTSFWDITGTVPISTVGPVLSGNSADFIVRVSIPGGALPGDFDIANITATSQGNASVSDGANVRTQVPFAVNWFDGFEGGWGAWRTEEWSLSSPPTVWEIGDPAGWGPGTGYLSTNCAGTNINDNYYDNPDPDIVLYSPYVQLGSGTQEMRVYNWYSTNAWGWGPDGGFVEISVNGGPWSQIYPVAGYPYPNAGCGGYNTDAYAEGASGGWFEDRFDLSAYGGQVVQARFHFAAYGGGMPGWYIDDVYMGAPPPYRCELTPDFQMNYGFPGTNVDYVLTVSNTGLNNDTYDLSYVNTVLPWTVTFRDIGDTTNITTIFVPAGNSTQFIARVSIPGGALSGDFDIANITATSQGNASVSDWALVRTQVPFAVNWFDGFEGGWGAWRTEEWSLSSPPTVWEIGDPAGWGPGTGYLSTNCAGTNINDNYYDNPDPDIVLYSPYVQLGSGTQEMRVYNWYSTNAWGWGPDGGFVEISVNGGPWSQIYPVAGYPYPNAGCGGYNTDAYAEGASGGWFEDRFDLSAYGGQVVQARFHFAAYGGGMPGWYVDDVYIGAPPPTGASATATGPVSAWTNVAGITITYTTANSPSFVDLWYSTDGGTTWNFAGKDTTVDGSFGWTIPGDGQYSWLAATNDTADPAPVGGEIPEAGTYDYDATPPAVDGTSPVNGSITVPINQDIVITFNETMNTTSFTYTIEPAVGNLSESWAAGDTVVTIRHANFTDNTTYWVNITAAKDLAGNDLTGLTYWFNFTTTWVAGATATATGTIGGPSNNATINITYSWTGTPTEVWLYYSTNGGTNWTLAGNDTSVDSSFGWTVPADGRYDWIAQAMGDNSTELRPPFNGTVPEAGTYIYDSTPPTATPTPADGTTGVSTAAGTYVIRFSEPMNTSAGTINETLPGAAWPGDWTWSADGMWLNGSYNALNPGTMYWVNLSGFQDLAGNALNDPDYSFNFTTQSPPPADITAPTSSVDALPQYTTTLTFQVSWTADDGTGSGVKEVELWFKKDSGGWDHNTYSGGSRTISFTADSDGTYSFYTRARDNENNYEDKPDTPDATTIVDTTNPVVSVDALPALTTDAVFDVAAAASDANGIAYLTLYYRRNNGAWQNYSSDDTSPYSWTFNTSTTGGDGTYDFYVLACDVPGNKWSAPTGATTPNATTLVDTTPPSIISRAPTGLNVSVGANITIHFSEPMNVTTAEGAFSISPSVQGSFHWNAQHTVLTFDPQTALAYSTKYTVTIGTEAMDQHGLALLQPYSWNFTTEAQPTGAVEGRVVDENGNPISGATVTLDGISTTTNETGEFRLENVPVGDQTLVVTHPDYERETRDVTVVADQTTPVDDIEMAPAIAPPPFDWLWLLLLLIIIVIAVLVIIFALKRRKRKEPEPYYPPPAVEQPPTQPGLEYQPPPEQPYHPPPAVEQPPIQPGVEYQPPPPAQPEYPYHPPPEAEQPPQTEIVPETAPKDEGVEPSKGRKERDLYSDLERIEESGGK